MSLIHVVLDINQRISAIIKPNWNPNQILQLWHLGLIELAIPAMLEEFQRVVRRHGLNRNITYQIRIVMSILRCYANLQSWYLVP